MNDYLLECCANSVQSAINGEKGGAKRIELCSQIELGGITPIKQDILQTKKILKSHLHILIRPRKGSIVYSENELSEMLSDIQFCKKIGCDGVVIGALKENGDINVQETKQMVNAAKPMHVTFNRAFDEGNNLIKNLEDVITCKCDTLLTAGQTKNVRLGVSNIKQLIEHSDRRINILAVGGVNHNNIKDLYKIGVRYFHLSGIIETENGKLTDPLLIKAVVDKLKQIA